ncbi:MAG: MBL fold metallo-hydrolase [Candidatus Aenigmarchaeota archaeon]|nr:MBL fold metallo-hydrolase [Candidatus Aenigmarchaeota archaeon]
MQFIEPAELKRKIDNGDNLLLLDVREPFEYEEWHIAGAVNVPVGNIMAGEMPDAEGKEIVAICMHGIRSGRIAQLLENQGLPVSTLKGGMVAWNGVYDVADLGNILQFRRVGKGCLSYMIMSDGAAVVVDPAIDINAYIEEAEKRNLKIAAVFDTHAHADHVSGARLLSEELDVPYYSSSEVPFGKPLKEGKINLGSGEIEVLSTPGHTPGSLTYLFQNCAITGDTLFVESVGRPDLGQNAGENGKILFNTLQNVVLRFSDEIKVLPGHVGQNVETKAGMPVTASLRELKINLPALTMTSADFIDWVVKNAAPKPANFEFIKQINLGKMQVPELEEIRELEAGPNRCAVA